jgi:hypothetical protein
MTSHPGDLGDRQKRAAKLWTEFAVRSKFLCENRDLQSKFDLSPDALCLRLRIDMCGGSEIFDRQAE